MTTATVGRPEVTSRRSDLGGKYLTFFLAKEEYGLMILKVQEIIGLMPVTQVPRVPDYVLGIINLRGRVIPVMDLRRKFGMARQATTDESCIIVVQSNGSQMGVLVDKVSEVLDIADSDIEDTPTFATTVHTEFIVGIGKSADGVKLLLDIDKVLAKGEVDTLQALGGEAPAGDTEG